MFRKSKRYSKKHKRSMPVLKELPVGIKEHIPLWSRYRKEAWGIVNDEYKTYVYCKACEGWIEGLYQVEQVNSLDTYRLSGRRGNNYYCPRCGEYIDFDGAVS